NEDRPDLVALLIHHGAQVDGRNRNGGTPLTQAIIAGQLLSTRRLIENGADVEQRDRLGSNALLTAARFDMIRSQWSDQDAAHTNREMMLTRLLIAHTARMNVEDR